MEIKTKANVFRKQAYYSVTCGYFCIWFIDFILKDKSLSEFTNQFSPDNFTQNGVVILY